jgi:hypothetical protein
MVRGLDALEFLERSRDLAAEAVVGTPMRLAPAQPFLGVRSGEVE